jgi:MFS family permease
MNGLNGAISAFDTPARTTLINELVPGEDLVQAQQLYGLAANTTSILGPALGGLLLSLGDTAIAFWFNAFSFIPVLISLLFIHPHPRAKSSPGPSIPMLTSIVEGLGYVRHNEQVRTLILLMSIVMILGMPYQTLLPMFAHKVLHAGSSEFAALSSAVGLGGFLGTLMTTNLGNNPQSGRWLFYTSLMFGLFIFLFVESPVIHWAALSVCLAGACSAITLNLDSGLIQSFSPETFRGRMTSISGLNKGALSISAALAGYASHYFGMVSIQIIFIILMVVSLLWLSPHLSKINQATLVAE